MPENYTVSFGIQTSLEPGKIDEFLSDAWTGFMSTFKPCPGCLCNFGVLCVFVKLRGF